MVDEGALSSLLDFAWTEILRIVSVLTDHRSVAVSEPTILRRLNARLSNHHHSRSHFVVGRKSDEAIIGLIRADRPAGWYELIIRTSLCTKSHNIGYER